MLPFVLNKSEVWAFHDLTDPKGGLALVFCVGVISDVGRGGATWGNGSRSWLGLVGMRVRGSVRSLMTCLTAGVSSTTMRSKALLAVCRLGDLPYIVRGAVVIVR